MRVKELAEAIGESEKAIISFLRTNRLEGHKVPDPTAVGKECWEITTTTEQARSIMSGRIRRARGNKRPASSAPLPPNKDLFTHEEVARLAGIGKSTVGNYVRNHGVKCLMNGRVSYVPKEAVEKIREHYRKPEPAPKVEARVDLSVAAPPNVAALSLQVQSAEMRLTRRSEASEINILQRLDAQDVKLADIRSIVDELYQIWKPKE